MTFAEFIVDVTQGFSRPGHEQRYGQFCFNRLHEIHPNIANSICGTAYDPFYATEYDDPRIIDFWAKVQVMWPAE
ncbi:hypothetical protein SEA_ENYGMA_288 [Streptomyces phage Enygma]